MANVDGGALSFKSVIENDQMNRAIEETLRRVQGLSDATVAGGKQMDKAFLQTADGIRQALGQIGAACEIHETELAKLEDQYEQLGRDASAAFMAGRDAEAKAIKETQAGIKGEITVRKQALAEARTLSNQLEAEAQKREEATKATERNEQANKSLRARIRELKEEMALLIDQGIDEQSEAYRTLVNELGRLQDIQGDIAQQGRILANDEANFQGIIQGLSGISGGFSAATGAVSLFAGENDNLQKIMTKVQSVMAITMGLQQVSQTLNKDSAFSLIIVRNAKELLTTANTKLATSLGISTLAAKALMATLTLGLSAAITGIITAFNYFSNKAQESRDRVEKLNKTTIEMASEPIAALIKLQAQWASLGDNIKAKEQFILENQKAFEGLELSINKVYEAENRLMNPEHTKAFISAQLAKAQGKAILESDIYKEKLKAAAEIQDKLLKAQEAKENIRKSGNPHALALMHGEDIKIKELQQELNGYNVFLEETTRRSVAITQMGQKQLDDLNRESLERQKHTIAGRKALLEQEIENLRYKRGTTAIADKRALASLDKNIRQKQAELERLEGSKSGTTTSGKDPFIEKLQKKKSAYTQYAKWQNSTNEDIRKAAKTEFADLIRSGNSYKDYLTKLQDQISKEPQNSQTKKQLSAIRNELAELEGTSVLDAFNESLQRELGATDDILKRLDIIAQKHKELDDDGTDVDSKKRQMLDDAKKNTIQKQEEETQKLLDDHASYLDRKIKLDLKYNNDLSLLERARTKATTDEERNSIDAAIANRKRQYDRESKLSGDPEYDQMLQTYRTFEQKKNAIDEEFKEKSRTREQMLASFQQELLEAQTEDEKQAIQKRIADNEKMAERMKKAYQEALSKLAIDEMKVSPDWEKLFGNLDEIGTKELERLLAMIEGQTAILGIELSPEDFKVIQDKVKELKNEIKERNPFKALAQGFRDFKDATKDADKEKALVGMLDNAGKAGSQLNDVLNEVLETLDALGVEGTEEIGHTVQALQGLGQGAADAVMGFMSGNPVQMVGGAIKAIGSVVNYFAGANDRRAERSIKKHQENVDRLTSTYKELEWQVGKALGGDVYKRQQASIENMKQQQREMDAMIEAERSKKKTDEGKIREWQDRKKELDRAIVDQMESISKDILQTDAKSVANQFGDALVAAFAKGEDAAKSFGDVTNSILKNVVLNQLKKNFLETQMDGLLKDLEKKIGYWKGSGGNKEFVFDGLTPEEIADFKAKAENATRGFKDAMKATGDLFKEVGLDNETSLTGAVKGVSEETASIVAGQLNAMRINQGEANNILRQQLATLSVIAQNTSYNRHLEKLDGILSALKSNQHDPLRSQGLQ